MSKYEYAYCESERRLIAIADIREDSKKDPHIYMQRYEGHLLCPECKQARLIVVQGADFPFFRAAPRSAHRDGCDFIRPEYVPTTTDAQNPANAKTIRSQLRRALAKTIERQIARADHAGGNGAAHHQPEDEGPLAQKLQRRKIAQRLIEMIPKSSELKWRFITAALNAFWTLLRAITTKSRFITVTSRTSLQVSLC